MATGDERFVGHMLDCAERIQQFTAGKSRAQFDADEMLRLAVIHLLQTIGEAAPGLSCLPVAAFLDPVASDHRDEASDRA